MNNSFLTSLKIIFVFTLTGLSLFALSASVFAAANDQQNTAQISQQNTTNEANFINQYDLPIQILPPQKKAREQLSDDQRANSQDTTTSTQPSGGNTGSAPQTQSSTSPVASAASPSTTQQPVTNSSASDEQQSQQHPYQSLHQKNVWEKLKTKPQNARQNNDETTDDANASTAATSDQNVDRRNIYK